MTNKRPAFTLDSLATATITFYITTANNDNLSSALAEYDDASLADLTIAELDENSLIFDLFLDSSIPYENNDIDALTNAEFHYTNEFRDMIKTAYADARIRLDNFS